MCQRRQNSVIEADRLINVPVAKHHSISRLTLAMKNLMGVIGGNRGRLHHNIAESLSDIASVIHSDLTVVDATRILTANGPQGGRLQDVERGENGSLGIVLVGHRRAEEGQDRVPAIFAHNPPAGVNLVGDAGVVIIQKEDNLLGIVPFGDAGKILDVGKKHREFPAVVVPNRCKISGHDFSGQLGRYIA